MASILADPVRSSPPRQWWAAEHTQQKGFGTTVLPETTSSDQVCVGLTRSFRRNNGGAPQIREQRSLLLVLWALLQSTQLERVGTWQGQRAQGWARDLTFAQHFHAILGSDLIFVRDNWGDKCQGKLLEEPVLHSRCATNGICAYQ